MGRHTHRGATSINNIDDSTQPPSFQITFDQKENIMIAQSNNDTLLCTYDSTHPHQYMGYIWGVIIRFPETPQQGGFIWSYPRLYRSKKYKNILGRNYFPQIRIIQVSRPA